MATTAITDDLDEESIQSLLGDSVRVAEQLSGSEGNIIELLRDHSICITSSQLTLSREVLTQLSDLELIAKTGTGLDNIDLTAAADLGIGVVHTPGVNAPSVAEHALALLTAVTRRVVIGHRAIHHGEWREGVPLSIPLREKTIGLVGYGGVGQQLAELLTGFNPDIFAYDPYVNSQHQRIDFTDLDSLLRKSDAVIIVAELTDETRGLIDRSAFNLMKESAIIVNVARGPIIAEDALVESLDDGQIAGAGLDVFVDEPLPETSPLLNRSDVVLTPHIAGRATDVAKETYDQITDLVNAYVQGKPLPNRCIAVPPSSSTPEG